MQAYFGGSSVRCADPTAANPCTIGAGTWVVDNTSATGSVFNALSYNSSAAQHDSISFDLNLGDHNPVQWAGSNYSGATYHVKIIGRTGASGGTVSVNIVNVENVSVFNPATTTSYFCGNIDTYSSGTVQNVVFECNDVTIDTLVPGRMALYITVVDKNPSSSGYVFGWSDIVIYRVDV